MWGGGHTVVKLLNSRERKRLRDQPGSGFGFRVSGSGFRFSGFGFWAPDFVFRVSGFGFRVSGFGFWFSGLGVGFRTSGVGCSVQGSGFVVRIQEFQSNVSFRVGFSAEGSTASRVHARVWHK